MPEGKNGVEQILDIEVESLRNRLATLEEDFARHITNYQSGVVKQREVEMLRKLFDTRCFCSVFGGLNKDGYQETASLRVTDPASFLEFLSYFHGHELLDDGDPGVAWQEYDEDHNDSYAPFKTVKKGSPRAKRFLVRCKEMHPGTKLADVEDVIALIDEHEAAEVRRDKLMAESEVFSHRSTYTPSKRTIAGRAACHAFLDKIVADIEKGGK